MSNMNPTTASWVNPAMATDQDGNQVAWDASTDMAGIELAIDNAPAVSVPTASGANTFDLRTLDAYKALKAGNHTLSLAIVTKEGATSSFVGPVTFPIGVTPLAPANLVLA